jgi:regulator of protease activity HflC (stomatin/prohibitin superfamily)
MNMAYGGLIIAGVASVGLLVTGLSSAYIVDEGRVAVITNMGQAVRQETPAGLQFKTPFIQGVNEFNVRERAMTGTFSATTSNQLSSNVTWSMNWQPDASRIMEIYVNYGSPEEFAANTILPRLNQALKAAIGQHTAIELSVARSEVAETMLQTALADLEGLPIIITSVQLDDYTLPDRYWQAVLAREEQREVTERERLFLQQQEIQAQQEVQTANAQAEATRARADAQAYETTTLAAAEAESIRLLAEAEADGIAVVQDSIAGNPLFLEYHMAEQWDGTLPTQMIPGSTVPFLNVGD